MKIALPIALMIIAFIGGCKHAPKVTVCVSDPIVDGFQCKDKISGDYFVLPYSESENYVALSPDDAEALFNYCKKAAANLQ